MLKYFSYILTYKIRGLFIRLISRQLNVVKSFGWTIASATSQFDSELRRLVAQIILAILRIFAKLQMKIHVNTLIFALVIIQAIRFDIKEFLISPPKNIC
jgi:hypothetical protein